MSHDLKLQKYLERRAQLTEVPDVPHGVNVGVTFVENDEQRRSRDTLRQRLAVQILPEATEHYPCYFNEDTAPQTGPSFLKDRNLLCI